MTITFVAASQEIKQVLKSWRGAARMTPISLKYQIWQSIGDPSPSKTFSLYVKDVTPDANNTTVTAGLTNPLTVANPIIYTPKDYPGLSNA